MPGMPLLETALIMPSTPKLFKFLKVQSVIEIFLATTSTTIGAQFPYLQSENVALVTSSCIALRSAESAPPPLADEQFLKTDSVIAILTMSTDLPMTSIAPPVPPVLMLSKEQDTELKYVNWFSWTTAWLLAMFEKSVLNRSNLEPFTVICVQLNVLVA
jgi:hypothetical protein